MYEIKRIKAGIVEIAQWLRALLPFQRTWIWFSGPMSSDSQPPVNYSSRGSYSTDLRVHLPTQQHTYMIKKKIEGGRQRGKKQWKHSSWANVCWASWSWVVSPHQAAETASAWVSTQVSIKYNQWKLQRQLDVEKQMDRHQEKLYYRGVRLARWNQHLWIVGTEQSRRKKPKNSGALGVLHKSHRGLHPRVSCWPSWGDCISSCSPSSQMTKARPPTRTLLDHDSCLNSFIPKPPKYILSFNDSLTVLICI